MAPSRKVTIPIWQMLDRSGLVVSTSRATEPASETSGTGGAPAATLARFCWRRPPMEFMAVPSFCPLSSLPLRGAQRHPVLSGTDGNKACSGGRHNRGGGSTPSNHISRCPSAEPNLACLSWHERAGPVRLSSAPPRRSWPYLCAWLRTHPRWPPARSGRHRGCGPRRCPPRPRS